LHKVLLQCSFVVVVIVECFAVVFVSGIVVVQFDAGAGTAGVVVIAVGGVVRWTNQIYRQGHHLVEKQERAWE